MLKLLITISVFFLCCTLFGQNNQVALELITAKGTEIKYVDSGIKELYFGKTYIQSINGLEKLEKLERIVFDMSAFIRDLSFLKKAPTLKNVTLVYVKPDDWTFIESLPDLEILCIRECYTQDMRLNLSNNKKLQYLEIKYCNLTAFPKLLNIPVSLRYLNLSSNSISSIPEYYKSQNDFFVLLANNNINVFQHKFILFDKQSAVLPEEYIIDDVSH